MNNLLAALILDLKIFDVFPGNGILGLVAFQNSTSERKAALSVMMHYAVVGYFKWGILL